MSAEKLREEFIAAGGTCTTEVGVDSTTTTSGGSTESTLAVPGSLESHDCGEGEASMYLYETETAALVSGLFIEGLVWGTLKAMGIDAEEPAPQIFVKNWKISLADDENAIASSMASELGGRVLDFKDPSVRASVLRDVAKGDPIVSLKEVSKGCLASEQLSSDGKSISFDTEGEEESDGDGVGFAFCTLRILGAPDYVFEKILTTRALDGRTEDAWDAFSANWTYHPDTGLRVTVVAESR